MHEINTHIIQSYFSYLLSLSQSQLFFIVYRVFASSTLPIYPSLSLAVCSRLQLLSWHVLE